ncbi:transposase [Cryobacterium sp. MP_3.1]|nr:transposase [Cryobacterium sp. MP_3.1]
MEIRLRWKDVNMPKPYPPEFRRDVVAVARKNEAPLKQIAKDFGISESCLANWLRKADVEEGVKPGVTEKESAELRDAKKRIRLLEQEAEVMRRAVAYLSRDVNPK